MRQLKPKTRGRDASRKDPTLGSRLPHVRIRPSCTSGECALGGLELHFESDRIYVGGASFELSRHLGGKHTAVQ
jgi:hypothetical protein